MAQCTAHSKQSGQRCKRRPAPGFTVCYMHGGASPVGIAHPNFKHGLRSKHLPARMMQNYEAARADPDLIALRDDIAMIDSRLIDVLGRVDTGEAGSLWAQAKQTFSEFNQAQKSADTAKAAQALTALGDLLIKGAGDWAAWEEIGRLVEQRRKLVDTEHKRLVAMRAMMSAEQAMTMFGAMAAIVRNHVSDPATLRRISSDFGRIYRGGSGAAITDGADEPEG